MSAVMEDPIWVPGDSVRIRAGVIDPAQGSVVGGATYRIEDLWTEIVGQSWIRGCLQGNPVCLHYAARAAVNDLPIDDDVLYGKIDGHDHLVHVSEIEPL